MRQPELPEDAPSVQNDVANIATLATLKFPSSVRFSIALPQNGLSARGPFAATSASAGSRRADFEDFQRIGNAAEGKHLSLFGSEHRAA